MKKLLFALTLSIGLASCTTRQQDIQYLQGKFDVVVSLDQIHSSEACSDEYICIDTLKNVYFVQMTMDGKIESQVKISK